MSQQVKLLGEIARGIRDMSRKIDQLVDLHTRLLDGQQRATPKSLKGDEPLDPLTLMGLPDHLRKTAIALMEIKRGTAEAVADATGNSRSIESAYLNQLQRQGLIQKERGKLDDENPKKVYFFI